MRGGGGRPGPAPCPRSGTTAPSRQRAAWREGVAPKNYLSQCAPRQKRTAGSAGLGAVAAAAPARCLTSGAGLSCDLERRSGKMAAVAAGLSLKVK